MHDHDELFLEANQRRAQALDVCALDGAAATRVQDQGLCALEGCEAWPGRDDGLPETSARCCARFREKLLKGVVLVLSLRESGVLSGPLGALDQAQSAR